MKMKTIPVLLLSGILLFTGCGASKSTESTASSVSSAAAASSAGASSPADSSSSAASDSSAALSSATASVTIETSVADSLPDYLRDSTAAGAGSAATASGYGEGTNVTPGEDISTAANAAEQKTGSVCTLTSSKGNYEVTVNSIELTSNRADSMAADKVVKVSYTFKNVSYDGTLLVGPMAFRLMDGDGKACGTYSFDATDSANYQAAEPTEKGQSCTATLYYTLTSSSNAVTLIFDDLYGASGAEYLWKASV